MVSYRELADFTDLDVIGCFMKLEKEDPFAALSYLAQWDYGEDIGEELMMRRQIFEGLAFTKYAEDSGYLALWQIGVEGITLYRKSYRSHLDQACPVTQAVILNCLRQWTA